MDAKLGELIILESALIDYARKIKARVDQENCVLHGGGPDATLSKKIEELQRKISREILKNRS